MPSFMTSVKYIYWQSYPEQSGKKKKKWQPNWEGRSEIISVIEKAKMARSSDAVSKEK